MNVPDSFAAGVIADRGAVGREWLAALTPLVESSFAGWGLRRDGDPTYGHHGIVVPVLRGDERGALKVTWPDATAVQEAIALTAWAGRGAVRLLDARPGDGVLLLERLHGDVSLNNTEIGDAERVSGLLLRRLALPAPLGVPRITDHVERALDAVTARWASLHEPFPVTTLAYAHETAIGLAVTASDLLVHCDLHYGNVLAGDREPWLAIDPKVVAGDVEYGLFPMMLRRPDTAEDADGMDRRLSTVVRLAGLDRERARGWLMVRTVDYLLWALDAGLTEDPKRCRALIEWLL